MFLAERFASQNRDQLSKFELDKQRHRIKYLFGRVKTKNRLDKDFQDKNYFKYVQLDETQDPTNMRDVHKAKLKGQFSVEMKKNFSPV